MEKVRIKIAVEDSLVWDEVEVSAFFEHAGRQWAIHPDIFTEDPLFGGNPMYHVTDVLTGRRLPIAHAYISVVEESARTVIDESIPYIDFSEFPILNPVA